MTERRTSWLLLGLLAIQLLLLAAQVPAAAGEGTVLSAAALRLIAPLAHLAASVDASFANLRTNLASRSALLEENRELEAEVAELRAQLVRLQGVQAQMERLAQAVEHAPAGAQPVVEVAEIVYLDRTSWLPTLILRASGGRMAINQPVVAADGLVGRVVEVSGPYARAQLITDAAAGVGAMIERTRRQGLVRGGGGGRLELDYVPLQAEVRIGDRVVTAGIDGVYPQGIDIGWVQEVEPGNGLHKIRLTPAVDFGKLDAVFLLPALELPAELAPPEPHASR
jgi:rod shape-determining protein MreC